jgi:hypothetical protein
VLLSKNKIHHIFEGCLIVHLPHEIIVCAVRMVPYDGTIRTTHTRPTQRLSRPPPIQKLGAENHMLQPNI